MKAKHKKRIARNLALIKKLQFDFEQTQKENTRILTEFFLAASNKLKTYDKAVSLSEIQNDLQQN